MSDTPETDGITFFATKDMMPPYNTVPAEFARKLERERDEARDDCERLNRLLRHETALGQGEIDHWAALERERDEAREALADIALMDTSGLAAPAVNRALRSLGQWKEGAYCRPWVKEAIQ